MLILMVTIFFLFFFGLIQKNRILFLILMIEAILASISVVFIFFNAMINMEFMLIFILTIGVCDSIFLLILLSLLIHSKGSDLMKVLSFSRM